MSNQQDKDWRDSEPFEHKKYKNFYQLAGGIFLTVIVLLLGGFIYSQPESGYWVNIYATIVGTVLTIAVLDRRAEHRAIHERKEELILQMGSPDNGFAVEAARILKQKGWLFDGTLIKARLNNADLTDAFLHSANLSSAYLQGAELNEAILAESNLENTFMRIASLKNANLFVANLTGVNLTEADLFRANLFGANLQKANLYGANFREADLRGANLKDAIIKETVFIDAKFNEATILPDGKKWAIDHDIYANYAQTDEW